MREKTRCRHCAASRAAAPGGRRPFIVQGSKPHYAPDLPFKLEHLSLELKVDPKAKTLEGICSLRVRTIAAGQGWLTLDQVGLTFDEVQVDGKKAQFEVEGNSLKVQLPQQGGKGPALGDTFAVSV